MVKYKQFLLSYVGNKYKETEKIKNINLDGIKTIIEPYGGSFGFSRYCFYNLGLTDKQYIIYDYNKELINFYKEIQKLVNEDKINDLMKEHMKEVEYMKKNFAYKGKTIITRKHHRLIDKKECVKYIKTIKNKLLLYMFSSVIGSNFFSISNKKNCDFEIFKHCKFINKDFYDEDINQFGKDCFFYLDPPYIMSCNAFYGDIGSIDNIYKKMYEIIFTKRKKCIFIHNYNWFIDFVYKKKKVLRYDKLYQLKKRIVKHVCYGNCKFNKVIE